jgi:DNA-binding winged helix-turn-helix (wHTH) protein
MAAGNSPDVPRLISFTVGDWLVEPKACRVSRGDTVVRLRPQLTDLLVCLARRAGQIVLRDEILSEVWPQQYIAESGLSRCVAELRQNLQDDAQEPRFIETIPKRGYRLVAPVEFPETSVASEAAALVSPPSLSAQPAGAEPDPVARLNPVAEPDPVAAPAGPRRFPHRVGWTMGSHYAVGIEAIACRTGESIDRELLEVNGKEQVLTQLDTAAARLRLKLGESRSSLRQYDVPIGPLENKGSKSCFLTGPYGGPTATPC